MFWSVRCMGWCSLWPMQTGLTNSATNHRMASPVRQVIVSCSFRSVHCALCEIALFTLRRYYGKSKPGTNKLTLWCPSIAKSYRYRIDIDSYKYKRGRNTKHGYCTFCVDSFISWFSIKKSSICDLSLLVVFFFVGPYFIFNKEWTLKCSRFN